MLAAFPIHGVSVNAKNPGYPPLLKFLNFDHVSQTIDIDIVGGWHWLLPIIPGGSRIL